MGLTALHLGSVIPAGGNFTLHFTYSARLGTTNTQQGLQRSAPFTVPSSTSSAEQRQHQQVLIATSTEPFGARSIMPCFDAPRFKASIATTITAPAELTALCNTEAVSVNTTAVPGKQVVTCATSPSMPTYMVAITVGQLVGMDATSASGIRINTWAVPGREGQLSTALQVMIAL